jgi:asparagine synthase (glutamine-hydrolysing)
MIYAGFIKYGQQHIQADQLVKVIGSKSQSGTTIVQNNNIILCYGKLSQNQDLDSIWENPSSLLIGRAFNREKSKALPINEFKSFTNMDTHTVLEKIWGKYIYIHNNSLTEQVEVITDSTGQLPFFYYRFLDGGVLFSSNIELIYKVLTRKQEYNWNYICSYLIYGNSSSIETPFKDIYELPPACCLTLNERELKITPFWNPLKSYKNQALQEQDAVSVLKSTLKPWLEPYNNIYVSLSGGLDSSSIVYCLNDCVKMDQNVKAINYFHSQVKTSNESIYARKVCEETGIELIELDISDSLPFDETKKKQPLKPNKPFPAMVSSRWIETIFESISSVGSSSFISGHGSDHIFMRPPSKNSTVDYIIENGIKGYIEKLEGISAFYRDPHVSTLKENLKGLLSYWFSHLPNKRSLKNGLVGVPEWIKPKAHNTVTKQFFHPIYSSLHKRTLPGKYAQIDLLYEGIASIQVELENQADPTYYPFLYQPVTEFALSFPTYNLFKNGYDRYPLRKSVSDVFQTNTVWRRDKSQTTGLFQLGLKRNLEKVLKFCLEGHCVKNGFIEKEELSKTIHLIANGDIKNLWPFLYIASMEMFFNSWDNQENVG